MIKGTDDYIVFFCFFNYTLFLSTKQISPFFFKDIDSERASPGGCGRGEITKGGTENNKCVRGLRE